MSRDLAASEIPPKPDERKSAKTEWSGSKLPGDLSAGKHTQTTLLQHVT